MASAIAKIRKEIVSYNSEFTIDSTETIIQVVDNQDGTASLFVLSYVRKGSGEVG